MYKVLRKCLPSDPQSLNEETPILNSDEKDENISTYKRARTIINGRIFHLVSIILTGFAVLFSCLIKLFLFGHSNGHSQHGEYFPRPESMSPTIHVTTLTFVALYLTILIYFCMEIVLRIYLNGKHFFWRYGKGLRLRNVYEFLIVFGDTLLSFIVIAKLTHHMTHPMLTFLGSLIPIRFAVYLLTAPPLQALLRGFKRAAKTIIFMLIFCAILIYVLSFISHLLFSPYLNPSCAVCAKRFESIQSAFFSILQVISCDTWVDDLVLPLSEQSIYGKVFVWSFFGLQVFLALFILLNIFTAVIVEGILPRSSYDEGPHNSEYSSDVSNYRLLREICCGICLLSKYVSKKQTHPEDMKYKDVMPAPMRMSQHDKVMDQLSMMTDMVKQMSTEIEQLRTEVRESRTRSYTIGIERPDDYHVMNSV